MSLEETSPELGADIIAMEGSIYWEGRFVAWACFMPVRPRFHDFYPSIVLVLLSLPKEGTT